MSEYHIPVLLQESVSALLTDPAGVYADATFGGGGHSREILSRLSAEGRLIAFDRDADARENAPEDSRFTLIRNNFRFIRNFLLLEGYRDGIDGILADLGVSSHQFDTPDRGFSFRYEARLDMRMDAGSGTETAADVVNGRSEQELEKIFRTYGEVTDSRRIARLICRAREASPILTTTGLESAIAQALPQNARHKALAKIYQALRIEVNQEMRSLEKFLCGAAESLRPGGRLAVITYHSLEDRMVKNFIRCGNVDGNEEKDIYGNVKAIMTEEAAPAPEEAGTRTPEEEHRQSREEDGRQGDRRKASRAGGFIINSIQAAFRADFLKRAHIDRYFLHIIYIFFLFVMAIWMKLEIEQTMAVMEENRERVMDYRIYHAQKTYEAVKLDRLTTVQTMLQEKGSALTIPDRPADVIKEK